MLRQFGERLEHAVLDGVGRSVSRLQERKPLRVDLLENDDSYLAVFDAPGATAQDVDVNFDENRLVVHVDRFRDYYEGFDMTIPGRGLRLQGSVDLPPEASVDAHGASATVTKNGTLQVRIPKTDPDEHVGVTEADAEAESDEPVVIDTDGTDAAADSETGAEDGNEDEE